MVDAADHIRERLAKLIAAYLARSPKAADTSKGISEWWLQELGAGVSHEDVVRALEILIRRGVVERTRLADGTELFRSAPTRH